MASDDSSCASGLESGRIKLDRVAVGVGELSLNEISGEKKRKTRERERERVESIARKKEKRKRENSIATMKISQMHESTSPRLLLSLKDREFRTRVPCAAVYSRSSTHAYNATRAREKDPYRRFRQNQKANYSERGRERERVRHRQSSATDPRGILVVDSPRLRFLLFRRPV